MFVKCRFEEHEADLKLDFQKKEKSSGLSNHLQKKDTNWFGIQLRVLSNTLWKFFAYE